MKATLLGIILFASLLGCQSDRAVAEGPAPAVRVRDPMAPHARIRRNAVVIIDKSLQNWAPETDDDRGTSEWWIFRDGRPQDVRFSRIAVESTNARRTGTGTIEVWATLRNRTDHDIVVECRAHFFDDENRETESPSVWQPVFLPQNSVATYAEYSTTARDNVFYYIEIREAR